MGGLKMRSGGAVREQPEGCADQSWELSGRKRRALAAGLRDMGADKARAAGRLRLRPLVARSRPAAAARLRDMSPDRSAVRARVIAADTDRQALCVARRHPDPPALQLQQHYWRRRPSASGHRSMRSDPCATHREGNGIVAAGSQLDFRRAWRPGPEPTQPPPHANTKHPGPQPHAQYPLHHHRQHGHQEGYAPRRLEYAALPQPPRAPAPALPAAAART